jgi:hypothetical protein
MAMPAAAVHAASYYMFLDVGSAWKGKPNPCSLLLPAAELARGNKIVKLNIQE